MPTPSLLMQVEGVKGPVTVAPYAGWIALEVVQIGANEHTHDSTGRDRQAGHDHAIGVAVSKKGDASSAALAGLAGDKKGRRVVIDLLRPDGGAVYFRYTLEGAKVATYRPSKPYGPKSPGMDERLTFDADRVISQYVSTAPAGKS